MLGGMHGDNAMNGTPSYDFLNLLYNREDFKGWDDFDIVAVHPYGFSTAEITTEIDKVRAVMDDHDDAAAPIWVSEMGWASAFDNDQEQGPLVGADPAGSSEHPDCGLEPDDARSATTGTSAASSGTRGATRSATPARSAVTPDCSITTTVRSRRSAPSSRSPPPVFPAARRRRHPAPPPGWRRFPYTAASRSRRPPAERRATHNRLATWPAEVGARSRCSSPPPCGLFNLQGRTPERPEDGTK